MKSDLMHLVKEDKKKLLFLAILACIAIFLLLFGGSMEQKGVMEDGEITVAAGDAEEKSIEEKLAETLSLIEGAGEVTVIITWDGDEREIYAYNEETVRRSQEGEVMEETEKTELVLAGSDDQPVVSERKRPAVEGVLVVAEGAKNDRVREKLLNAAATYLNIGKNRVEVATGEGS